MSFSTPTLFRRLPTTLTPLTRAFTSTTPAQLARMQLIGRLGAQPELTATSTGKEIVKYSVATSHGPKDNRQTSWYRVVAFEDAGPRRDLLTSLPKGTLVFVDAESKLRTYEEEGTGQRRVVLDLTQQRIDVLSRPLQQVEGAGEEEAAMA